MLSQTSFDDVSTQYIQTACLKKKECYSFTIFDSYGDGFEAGKGSYSLLWNSQVVVTGGSFGSAKSQFFGKCNKCKDGFISFELQLLTDSFASEVSWELRKFIPQKNKYKKIRENKELEDNTFYHER